MACVWADFPSGQRGLYNKDRDKMMNGVWAENFNAGASSSEWGLKSDPDPNYPEGVVLAWSAFNIHNMYSRIVDPSGAQQTAGMSFRLWMDRLPVSANHSCPLWSFLDNLSNRIVTIGVLPDGSISAYSGAFGSTARWTTATLIGTTSTPVVTANAWNHIETKVYRHASTGTLEVRVNGLPVLALTGLNLGSVDVSQISLGAAKGNGADGVTNTTSYYKDFIYWNGSGSEFNDFQGSVSVRFLTTNGDDSFNWDTSDGGTTDTWEYVDWKAINSLTILNTSLLGAVNLAGVWYQFDTYGGPDINSPAGTQANPWRVNISGAGSVTTIAERFAKAITNTGIPGTDYSTALVANPKVDAYTKSVSNPGVVYVRLFDVADINLPISEDLTWMSIESSSWFLGVDDSSYAFADNTPPAASTFTMDNLPPDITSVRAIIPVGRFAKSDGGDCNIQMSVSPDGTNWDDGADRAITTAFTYWWDVSHLSPATSTRWTPTEIDNLKFKVNRTL